MQKLANKLWDEYCEIFPKLVKFDCPRIRLCNRLTKTAGYWYYDTKEVTLSTKFIAQFTHNMQTVILPHELAHAIDDYINGIYPGKWHHGKQWKQIMLSIGQTPLMYHSMELK